MARAGTAIVVLAAVACTPDPHSSDTVSPGTSPDTGDPPEILPPPLAGIGPVGRTDISLVADLEIRGYRTGGVEGPQLGEGVVLGDFDGDGLDDVFAGASSWDLPVSNQGAGWGLAASDLGLCEVDPTDASHVCWLERVPNQFTVMITGNDKEGATFGTQLASGDLDADGLDDLVVASPGIGNVTVWYGRVDMAWVSGSPDVVIAGPDTFGSGVAILGDVNGDGCNDLAVGAHSAGGSGLGQVHVWYTPAGTPCGRLPPLIDSSVQGSSDVRLQGPHPDTFAGTSIAAAGDVDGDGDDDFLVGAPNSVKSEGDAGPGEIWLVYGGADSREIGSCAPPCAIDLDEFGATGSFDGVRYTLDPWLEDSWLGNKVAGVGDATGDGCDDILLGAMKYGGGGTSCPDLCGAAFLLDGRGACDGGERRVSDEVVLDGSGDDYVAVFTGSANNDKLGEAISGAGDANGDGVADLLIGVYRDDEVGIFPTTENGAAFLVYGGWSGFDEAAPATVDLGSDVCDDAGAWPEDLPPTLKIYGHVAGDFVAKHTARGGDVNGDGLDDLLIGAPRWGANDDTCGSVTCDKGSAYVVYGDSTGACLDQ
jgi:hypothetical protein